MVVDSLEFLSLFGIFTVYCQHSKIHWFWLLNCENLLPLSDVVVKQIIIGFCTVGLTKQALAFRNL